MLQKEAAITPIALLAYVHTHTFTFKAYASTHTHACRYRSRDLPEEELKQCLYSIGDNNAYLHQVREVSK